MAVSRRARIAAQARAARRRAATAPHREMVLDMSEVDVAEVAASPYERIEVPRSPSQAAQHVVRFEKQLDNLFVVVCCCGWRSQPTDTPVGVGYVHVQAGQ